jgi:hypothetical protein
MANYQPNSGRHVDDIVSRTSCEKHNAPEGIPCFYIRSDKVSSDQGLAVCGSRIRKAGFNGKIHPKSLSQGHAGSGTRFRR